MTKLEKDIFKIAGPVHLTAVDWNKPDHRRCVVASLVQGVYALERERQNRRTEPKSADPAWWESFHFQCIETLNDRNDSSTFGAIYEYKPHIFGSNPNPLPPRYVVAFRGTIFTRETGVQDIRLGLEFTVKGLVQSSRYRAAFQAVESIIQSEGSLESVWLAGHSLGAAIALQIGKDMVRRKAYIETYLFNPPYPSAPIEKIIKFQHLKKGIRAAKSVATASLSKLMQGVYNSSSRQQCDSLFVKLCSWRPYLFVNVKDPVCCEYVGYFEHREWMEKKGASRIENISTRDSILSVVLDSDQAPHKIPSAFLTKNTIPMQYQSFDYCHGVHQWLKPHTYWETKLYQFK